jgi:hypothetical protein
MSRGGSGASSGSGGASRGSGDGASRGSGGGASSGSGWLSWGGGWLSWGTPPLSLLSLFVLGFRVVASLLDHHKKAQHPHLPPDKGPTPPLTTRQGSFMILLFHSYTIVNLIVKEL